MDKNFYEKCAKFLNVVLPQFTTKVWDKDSDQCQLRIENTTCIYWLLIERGGISNTNTFLLSKEIYVEGTRDYPPDTDIHDVAELPSIQGIALFIASDFAKTITECRMMGYSQDDWFDVNWTKCKCGNEVFRIKEFTEKIIHVCDKCGRETRVDVNYKEIPR